LEHNYESHAEAKEVTSLEVVTSELDQYRSEEEHVRRTEGFQAFLFNGFCVVTVINEGQGFYYGQPLLVQP